MNFQFPWLLLGLLPLAVFWWTHARRSVSPQEKARFPLLIASLVCLVVTLANPYWSTVPEKRLVKGVDLVLLVDVSQSMFCPVEGSQRRIDQVRSFTRSILPQFSGSQAALVYFAGDAQIGCPFTADLNAVILFMDSISPNMTSKPGTQSAPLREVLNGMIHPSAMEPKQTLALLFSDGEFFDSTEALQSWGKEQERFSLFTFLCGKGKAAVPEYNNLSKTHPNAVSAVRPETLQSLSPEHSYDLNQAPSEALARAVAGTVREMLTRGRQVPQYRQTPFLILAVLLLLAYQAFPALRFRRNTLTAALATSLLVMTSLSMKPEESFSKAIENAAQGRSNQALEALKKLQQEGASEEVEIAIGNIHFQQEKFDEAIQYYRQALQRNPANQTARWNWEVALKRKTHPENPPPKPSPQAAPLPQETRALLRYFDQQEREQIQLTNSINANNNTFAW